MRSFASYNIALSGTKSNIREALFCLADVICDQENVLSEFYIYSATQPMFESKNYSVEKLEEELSEIVPPLLPTITELLRKKN